MKSFNIYLIGVGGQGIGLLAEILLRAADHAGFRAKAVDTHGLAQRGGIVVSQVRLGENIHSPLIPERSAHLAVALERHEAARAVETALAEGATLIYYNTSLQPLPVRLGVEEEVTEDHVHKKCADRNIRVISVELADLEDARMENIALLARLCSDRIIPGLEESHYRQAMEDLMSGSMLEKNLGLFQELTQTVTEE